MAMHVSRKLIPSLSAVFSVLYLCILPEKNQMEKELVEGPSLKRGAGALLCPNAPSFSQ